MPNFLFVFAALRLEPLFKTLDFVVEKIFSGLPKWVKRFYKSIYPQNNTTSQMK
jgi:hypothetical protein